MNGWFSEHHRPSRAGLRAAVAIAYFLYTVWVPFHLAVEDHTADHAARHRGDVLGGAGSLSAGMDHDASHEPHPSHDHVIVARMPTSLSTVQAFESLSMLAILERELPCLESRAPVARGPPFLAWNRSSRENPRSTPGAPRAPPSA